MYILQTYKLFNFHVSPWYVSTYINMMMYLLNMVIFHSSDCVTAPSSAHQFCAPGRNFTIR